MLSLFLCIALQLPTDQREMDRIRAEELRKLESMRYEQPFLAAKQREAKYREDRLKEAHLNFIVKFNAYLVKYKQGLNPIKEKKEAIQAWKHLEKTEGFSVGNPTK